MYFNGDFVGDGGSFAEPMARNWNRPLLFELPMDDRWSSLAKGFSLLTPWTWFLAALGWKTWGRTGWGQAATVALLPWGLVYGGMIAWALFQ